MSIDMLGDDDDQVVSIPPAGEDEGGSFDFPEGTYGIYVKGFVSKTSQSSGQPMIEWHFAPLPGAGMPNGTYWFYTTLAPGKLWSAHKTCRALGIGVQEDGSIKLSRRGAIGRRAMGTFKKDTYQGKTKTKLDSVEAHPEGPGPIELNADGVPF